MNDRLRSFDELAAEWRRREAADVERATDARQAVSATTEQDLARAVARERKRKALRRKAR